MATPIMTDEDLAKEKNETVSMPKKSMEEIVKSASADESLLDKEIVEEAEKEVAESIPSHYIEINLMSNGRIEGIPKKLHFRCYSASDALDLNVSDEAKAKAVAKVLTNLNYEKFDISLLPINDILFILYSLHGAFISKKITKKVYIDDSIEDEKILNDESNLEEVDIPISSIKFAYLGKDYDDNELSANLKVPFTVKDKATGDKVSFRYSILKDVLLAESYCRNYYKDEFLKFADIRSSLNKVNSIRDEEKKDAALDDYLDKNEEKASEYYEFMIEYTKMVAKIVQAQAIVSFNGKKLESVDEKWKVYRDDISLSMWTAYNDVLEKYPFGVKEECEVFIPSLRKKVTRRVGFQFDDFIHIDKRQESDRCVVEFD